VSQLIEIDRFFQRLWRLHLGLPLTSCFILEFEYLNEYSLILEVL